MKKLSPDAYDVPPSLLCEDPSTERLPLFYKLLFVFTGISLLLYLLFTKLPVLADGFNETVSAFGRRLLSYLTVLFPFSVAEWLLLSLPVLLVALIVVGCRRYSFTWRATRVYILKLLAIPCVIAILFVWNFAPGYYGTTLDRRLGLERREVSAEELFHTALILSQELHDASGELLFPDDESSSVMPYSYGEMNKKLMDAYDSLSEKQALPDHFYSRVKPVMLSRPMSYTHITGVYTFFTGEANINAYFPDYTIPFTAAHELAHQRGVAREDEANMVAFLVCLESDDPYIRYSGAMSVYEYVASALYSADREKYATVYHSLPDEVHQELRAYNAFFEEFRDNVVADISQATNDAYLQSQGASAGTRSYGMVVDLTVAYFRPRFS